MRANYLRVDVLRAILGEAKVVGVITAHRRCFLDIFDRLSIYFKAIIQLVDVFDLLVRWRPVRTVQTIFICTEKAEFLLILVR